MWIPTTQENVVGGGAFVQLYDNTASGTIASWDVTGISQGYNHLKIILLARGDISADVVTACMRFNNDSAGNYIWQNIYATNTTVAASQAVSANKIELGAFSAGTAGADIASHSETFVPGYAGSTFRKTSTSNTAAMYQTISGGWYLEPFMGFWNNKSAITQITIFPASGNWISGSRLSIYGML